MGVVIKSQVQYTMSRQLLTEEEFAALKKAPKAEILRVLERYVKRSEKGRPTLGERPMTSTERSRRHREKRKRDS